MAGAANINTAWLARVSIGTVTKVAPVGKTSAYTVGYCGRQHTYDDSDACALVR